MATVLLTEVSKTYPGSDLAAVRDVTLEIEDGEFFVLLGPSGCGKSTLLKLIAGLEEPDEGLIQLNEGLVNYERPGERDVAMVFQDYALYPHMTVRKNVGFPLRMRKTDKAKAIGAVVDAIALLGLEDFEDRRVGELSGGQRQRVAVARAIVRNPAVMLMDEPLSNLDALLRMRTREELLKLQRRSRHTVIYVTHDQVEAMTMGDRIGVMRDGELVQVGAPGEVYGAPADRFVAGFMGSPPMNLLKGEIVDRAGSPSFASGGVDVALPAAATRQLEGAADLGQIELGIRPEAIELTRADGLDGDAWRVELIENLGAEHIVVAQRKSVSLRVRAAPMSDLGEGDAVQLTLDPGELHVFDQRGARVGGPGLEAPVVEDAPPVPTGT